MSNIYKCKNCGETFELIHPANDLSQERFCGSCVVEFNGWLSKSNKRVRLAEKQGADDYRGYYAGVGCDDNY